MTFDYFSNSTAVSSVKYILLQTNVDFFILVFYSLLFLMSSPINVLKLNLIVKWYICK